MVSEPTFSIDIERERVKRCYELPSAVKSPPREAEPKRESIIKEIADYFKHFPR